MNGVDYDTLSHTFKEGVKVGKELMVQEIHRDLQTLLTICKEPEIVQLINIYFKHKKGETIDEDAN